MIDLLLRLLGTGVLLGLCAAASFAAWQTDTTIQPKPVAVDTQQESEPAVAGRERETYERNDVYYQAILDRPVFEISRRPVEPDTELPEAEPEIPVMEVEDPAPELPNVSLLGVMSTGSRTRALISVEGNEPLWLSEGDKIGGWTITSAGEDWLELVAEDNKVRLELFK